MKLFILGEFVLYNETEFSFSSNNILFERYIRISIRSGTSALNFCGKNDESDNDRNKHCLSHEASTKETIQGEFVYFRWS